jgi:hypothetical protein
MSRPRSLRLPFAVGLVLLGGLGCASPLFGSNGLWDWDGDGFGDKVDCNDADPAVYPGAGERCDGGTVDDDCDGKLDDDDDDVIDPPSWFRDHDGDGYGDPDNTDASCEPGDGFVDNGDDCNDESERIHPDTDEVCDAEQTDEDCDGLADDDDPDVSGRSLWFADEDGDDHGDAATSAMFCIQHDGWVETADDCDDTDDNAHPGAHERCDADNVDEDCDGGADDDDPKGTVEGADWYYDDVDGDGYGSGNGQLLCDPLPTQTNKLGDCDDANSTVSPDGVEVCGDGLDQDCDGSAAGCVVKGEIDDNTADAHLVATDESVKLGWDASVGDVDGDGAPEVWLSAIDGVWGTHTGTGGAVRVVGALSGTYSPDDFGLLQVRSNTAEELGYRVAANSDLTGDGLDDLVLTAPKDDTKTTDAGAVWIFPGPVSPDADEGDAAFKRTGEESSDQLGTEIATGDWNGDGVDDLFYPEWGDGDVYGELGPLSGASSTASSVADVKVTATASDRMEAGDLDGDGQIELVFGDTTSGKVSVYTGGDKGTLTSSDRSLTFTSTVATTLGMSLLVGSDLDGDGYGDLVMGDAEYNGQTGLVYVVYGPASGTLADGDADVTLNGGWAVSEFGSRLGAGGDTNGNDDVELYVAATYESVDEDHDGAVYVYDGLPRSGTLSTNSAIAVVSGHRNTAQLGWCIAIADLDDDGVDDVLLGARYFQFESIVGGAGIWYGADAY